MRQVPALLVLVALGTGCSSRKGAAPTAGASAALTPCRHHLGCINRCVDTPEKRRNPPAVQACTAACELSAPAAALAQVRALRLCEYQRCGDLAALAGDTAATVAARQLECARKSCPSERRWSSSNRPSMVPPKQSV